MLHMMKDLLRERSYFILTQEYTATQKIWTF